MVFTSYLPRDRLYWAEWPPLVLLDPRVGQFCEGLGGLCRDLEKAMRAAGLGAGSVEELSAEYPQLYPVLLQMLNAKFAGPFAQWWEALKEDRFPSVAERWEAGGGADCHLAVSCPVSHAALLSSPARSLRLLRRCVYLNKKWREAYGKALWDVVRDEGPVVEALKSPREWLKPLFADLPPPAALARCKSTASSMRGRRLVALALFKYWAEEGREPYVDRVFNWQSPRISVKKAAGEEQRGIPSTPKRRLT